MSGYDWVVFTTVNGVEGFMNRMIERGRDCARAGRSANLRRRCRHERAVGRASAFASTLVAEGQSVDGILAAMGGRAAWLVGAC